MRLARTAAFPARPAWLRLAARLTEWACQHGIRTPSRVFLAGSYWAWKASAIGKHMLNAKTFLEKRCSAAVAYCSPPAPAHACTLFSAHRFHPPCRCRRKPCACSPSRHCGVCFLPPGLFARSLVLTGFAAGAWCLLQVQRGDRGGGCDSHSDSDAQGRLRGALPSPSYAASMGCTPVGGVWLHHAACRGT